MRSVSDPPWLVIGDLNEALWDFEHLSSIPRPEPRMVVFRDTLEVCELVDLGFSGIPFTYDNHRAGVSNVKVHLDRAIATNTWCNMFPFYFVQHVVSPCLGQVALVLKGAPDLAYHGPKARQYEVFWERNTLLPDVIKEAWDSMGEVHNLDKLQSALSRTMATLSAWAIRTSKTFLGSCLSLVLSWRS